MTSPADSPATPHAPSKRILLCGHRSFAAQGLAPLLQQAGHSVVTFSRGPEVRQGDAATGPVDRLHEHPQLTEPFDLVINYILLKDEKIEPNERFIESLLKFCVARSVKHLIHISSMSVYSGDVRLVREDSPIETNPNRKGSYGSLKVAQDLMLLRDAPAEMRLSMVRPGFVLAPGLVDPIVGMAVRFGLNKLLLIGAAGNTVPVITRDLVSQAVARIADLPARSNRDVYLLADSDSPTREQWLAACCTELGAGTSVMKFPALLWRMAGWGGQPVAWLAGLSVNPNKIMSNVCRVQQFDTARTASELGLAMKVDWRATLKQAFPGQEQNYQLPYSAIHRQSLPANNIAIVGFGKIVKQKHLPALARLSFGGEVLAYDVAERRDDDGRVIRAIQTDTNLSPANLVVVASPGPAHAAAIPLLKTTDAPLLIEKPLCLNQSELHQWEEIAKTRSAPIYVCHNYRFKSNVALMMAHLARWNPGKLLRADVVFHSPSVGKDGRAWARDERRAQTLLLDYSIHFLDLACMFNSEKWTLESSRYELDQVGNTSLIEGRLNSPAYPVNFVLRQGFMPRRARVFLTFQNYSASLGFFPDTLVPHMADDSAPLYGAEKRASFRATIEKVADKLTGRDSDHSHDATYVAALADKDLGRSITVPNLIAFYRAVFDLAGAVYG